MQRARQIVLLGQTCHRVGLLDLLLFLGSFSVLEQQILVVLQLALVLKLLVPLLCQSICVAASLIFLGASV